MKGKRKFLSEHAVNIYSAGWLALPANQLAADATMEPEQQAVSDRSHIYLICQHPAFAFDSEAFSFADSHIKGAITFRIHGQQKRISFDQEFRLLDGATELRLTPYPHREIHTFDERGEGVRRFPAGLIGLAPAARLQHQDLAQFEVLYVGQAFGDGSRTSFDRLKSHSTLQEILADAQYHSPDMEVFLFLFEYKPYRIITQMDGRAKEAIHDDRDSKRFFSIIENPLSEHQQVSLVEAALIRYFSPKYNSIYKETFPSQDHKVLEQCYELDFSALIVEINTDELAFQLFSQKVPAAYHHIANIDLFGEQDRLGFFHLFGKPDNWPSNIIR